MTTMTCLYRRAGPPAPLPRLCALALALLLAGCAGLRMPYTPPAAQLPAQWQAPREAPAAISPEAWWQAFGDPRLDALVQQVLARNTQLAAASLRLQRARLQAGLAAEAQRPAFGAGASASANRPLEGGSTTRNHAVTLSASYEADLWGRLARQRDAAEWEAHATEQDRHSTSLSLAATTATLYWQLAWLNQRIALSQDSMAYASRTLELVRRQKAAGAVSGLETLQAEQSLASQEAAHTALLQQRTETRHALALLLDGPPQAASPDHERDRLPEQPLPPVDAGLPAELLARRPDLRAAELRLRSTLAQVDVARASFYPELSLTGALGGSSRSLGQLLSHPVGSLGLDLSLPFLHWNELQLQLKVSRNTFDEAVLGFRQSLYQALADVENALSARSQLEAQGAKLQQALDASRQAERLYESRWRAGAEPLRAWLDAQEKRRQAELALAQNRLDRLSTHVALVQALGGEPRATAAPAH